LGEIQFDYNVSDIFLRQISKDDEGNARSPVTFVYRDIEMATIAFTNRQNLPLSGVKHAELTFVKFKLPKSRGQPVSTARQKVISRCHRIKRLRTNHSNAIPYIYEVKCPKRKTQRYTG